MEPMQRGIHRRPWAVRPFLQRGWICLGLACGLGWVGWNASAEPPVSSPDRPTGQATLRANFAGDELTLRTTTRLAGAVDSIRWRGQEFIDSFDHGRQLQSASSFDAGKDTPFWAESYNPTEAGSRADGAGPTSTSRLLEFDAKSTELTSLTQMAFWVPPGETTSGRPAWNQERLSKHRLRKTIRLGMPGFPQVLEYDVTFTVPPGEPHRFGQFEALTGYMPPEFSEFYTIREDGRREPLSDGPGEQAHPVLFSTKDGRFAMGIYSPDQPARGFESLGYGRFRFTREAVVKWNCVFRVKAPQGLPAGDYHYRLRVPVGTRDDVTRDLARLRQAQR